MAVPPQLQAEMARLGGFDVVRVNSGHAPFLTVPEDVVATVVKVAASA